MKNALLKIFLIFGSVGAVASCVSSGHREPSSVTMAERCLPKIKSTGSPGLPIYAIEADKMFAALRAASNVSEAEKNRLHSLAADAAAVSYLAPDDDEEGSNYIIGSGADCRILWKGYLRTEGR